MREIVIPTFYCLSQPICAALERLADAGVRLVEIHGDEPDRHIDLTNEAAADALAQAIAQLPLTAYSVHCAFSKPSEDAWDISHPDAATRKEALRSRAKVIHSAARLSAHHVVLHSGVRERSKERLANARAALAELAESAREAGVRIAVENLPPDHLGGSLAEMRQVLAGLDPEVVGFCLDTGHALLGADAPGDYIRAFGDRLLAIHWHESNCHDDAHLFPGVGATDWSDFFAALDEVGYDLPVTVEAVPPLTVPLAEALGAVRSALRERRAPRFSPSA